MPNSKKLSLIQPAMISIWPAESVSQGKAVGIERGVLPKFVWHFTGDGLTSSGKWEVSVPSELA